MLNWSTSNYCLMSSGISVICCDEHHLLWTSIYIWLSSNSSPKRLQNDHQNTHYKLSLENDTQDLNHLIGEDTSYVFVPRYDPAWSTYFLISVIGLFAMTI